MQWKSEIVFGWKVCARGSTALCISKCKMKNEKMKNCRKTETNDVMQRPP